MLPSSEHAAACESRRLNRSIPLASLPALSSAALRMVADVRRASSRSASRASQRFESTSHRRPSAEQAFGIERRHFNWKKKVRLEEVNKLKHVRENFLDDL